MTGFEGLGKIVTYSAICIICAVALVTVFLSGPPATYEQTVTVSEPEIVKTIVSYEFPPGYNNPDVTELQKEAYFEGVLKDNYVQWTGIVSDVTLSGKSTVKLSVDHGPSMTCNALIRLNDDQASKAITLKRGDTVTYTAKMTRWGSFLGFYGENGVLV